MHSLVFLSMSHPPGFSPQPLIAARAAKSGRESGGSPDGFPLFFLCEGSVDWDPRVQFVVFSAICLRFLPFAKLCRQRRFRPFVFRPDCAQKPRPDTRLETFCIQ